MTIKVEGVLLEYFFIDVFAKIKLWITKKKL